MLYVGIDPGKGGAVASLDDAGKVVALVAMPSTELEIWELFEFMEPETTRVMFEKLSGVVYEEKNGAGGKKIRTPKQSPARIAEQYRNYGHLQMALAGHHLDCEEILPRQWQQMMGISKGGKDTYAERKERSRVAASKLFPQQFAGKTKKWGLTVADALLIAEFQRRVERGSSIRSSTKQFFK